MKRILSILLAVLMISMVIPISSFTAFADPGYIAKAKLLTSIRLDGYKTEPAPDESGWASTPRQFKLQNIQWQEGYELDAEGKTKLHQRRSGNKSIR